MPAKSRLLLLASVLTAAFGAPLNATKQTRAGSVFIYDPLKTGYVAFGDSYAAGVGAGSTTWDGCRIGTNSYPNQLNQFSQNGGNKINFQNLPCTGAIAAEVLKGHKISQIDKWTSPGKADRATLSIGGNDVGFYNVLTSCILRIERFWAGDCDQYINEAYSIMRSPTFHNNVDNILHQIIDKSGRKSDFKIVRTGYPRFFNDKTDSCDYTTFYFWEPGHHGIHRGESWAYLYKEKRSKLNKLVDELNNQLQIIIGNVNKQYSSPRVIFADPNPAFEGHRFCEPGITEPAPNNAQNYFFLSSWSDKTPDTNMLGWLSGWVEDMRTPILTKQTIPDAKNCARARSWDTKMICGMKKDGMIWNNAQNTIAIKPMVQLPDGREISTKEIGTSKPTAWVKTFHPSSKGHRAIRDLVRSLW